MGIPCACCSYKEAWDSFVDAWLVVRVKDPEYAYKWRLQAEHAMRDSGKPAMTDEQVTGAVEEGCTGFCFTFGSNFRSRQGRN